MSEQIWWYVARSGGLVSWGLGALSILYGLALSTRAVARRTSPAWLLDLHRFLSGLTCVFLVVHLAGVWFDSYVEFGIADLFVPMASTWRPGAVAWGIVAFWLLLAVEITSLVRHRIPTKVWRGVHFTSFLVFVAGTVHGVQAGEDASNRVVWWGGLLVCLAVALFTGYRVLWAIGRRKAKAMRRQHLAALRVRAEAEAEAAAVVAAVAEAPGNFPQLEIPDDVDPELVPFVVSAAVHVAEPAPVEAPEASGWWSRFDVDDAGDGDLDDEWNDEDRQRWQLVVRFWATKQATDRADALSGGGG